MVEAAASVSNGSCFERAAEHIANHLAVGLPPDKLLQLYGLYKQAVCGRCNTSRPSWYQVQAKQKWDAWMALGDMHSEAAMEEYVRLVCELDPEWEGDREPETKKHTFGWVSFSCMAKPDDVAEAEKTIFDWVKEGSIEKLEKHVKDAEADVDVNCRDEDGLGLIHWAADRGHIAVLQYLVSELNADVSLRDQDGQTALHYAASCGHGEVVQFLLTVGASTTATDNDGMTPSDAAASKAIAAILDAHRDEQQL